MAKKLTISFKETTKDMKLYSVISSMEDKSYFIKEAIRKALIEKNLNRDEEEF